MSESTQIKSFYEEGEETYLEQFYTSEVNGRLYDHLTDELATDEQWKLWFDIRMRVRLDSQAEFDHLRFLESGYDRRIGGGISWNRANR